MGRNSRRKQRQDLELLEHPSSHPPASDTDSSDQHPVQSPSFSAINKSFNLFNSIKPNQDDQDHDGNEEEEEDEEQGIHQDHPQNPIGHHSDPKKKKRKKKKKPNHTINANNHDPDQPVQFENTKDHRRINSSTQKNILDPKAKTDQHKRTQNPQHKSSDSIDEIDRALQELGVKIDPLKKSDGSKSKASIHQDNATILNDLLKIDPKMLDPDLELRRMFGARVVSSSSTATAMGTNYIYGPRISNNPHHQLNSKLKSKSHLLVKPNPNWPPFNKTSIGLSLKPLEPEQIKFKKLSQLDSWFTFHHSPSFKFIQSHFLTAIMSLDPNQLVQLLHRSAYHPDTLLQLSEISSQNEDQGTSLNFLNQTLYVNEKVLNGSHVNFFNSGNSRLDFKSIENRNFFRALNLKLNYLIKQGCYRTALETCKLLFSLDPYQDPYASLLWIDFLAVKSNQYQFLLSFIDQLPNLQNRDPEGGIYTEAYPGLYYTKALCLRAIEQKNYSIDHDPSDFALESAILRFPQVIKPISEVIGMELPEKFEEIIGGKPEYEYKGENSEEVLIHLKSQIFVHRSSSIWKIPERSNWFKKIFLRSFDKFFSMPQDPDVLLGLDFNSNSNLHSHSAQGIYRAIFVSDIQRFKKFLPPSIYSNSNTSFSFDPVPPIDGTRYDEDYFKEIKGNKHNDNDNDRRAGQMLREEDFLEDELLNQQEEDDDNDEIFDDELEIVELDDQARNRLIQEIQFTLEIDTDDNQLTIDQRQFLLSRLDALLDHQNQLQNQNQNDSSIPSNSNAQAQQDVNHDNPSNQMPGSFVD